MQKEYSAVKITNPIIQGHLIRLYSNQKLVLILNDIDSEINILSDFLVLEKREILLNQLTCTFSQKYPQFNLKESVFFMGEIYISSKHINSSLCVFLSPHGVNRNSISVINPNKQICRFDADQTLDVYFLNKKVVNYSIIPGQHVKLINLTENYNKTDQFFKFQLDQCDLSALPCGKYESGKIVFFGENEDFEFNLVLNWNKKIYSVLPKYRKIMRSFVKIKKIEKDMETDCKVIHGS